MIQQAYCSRKNGVLSVFLKKKVFLNFCKKYFNQKVNLFRVFEKILWGQERLCDTLSGVPLLSVSFLKNWFVSLNDVLCSSCSGRIVSYFALLAQLWYRYWYQYQYRDIHVFSGNELVKVCVIITIKVSDLVNLVADLIKNKYHRHRDCGKFYQGLKYGYKRYLQCKQGQKGQGYKPLI